MFIYFSLHLYDQWPVFPRFNSAFVGIFLLQTRGKHDFRLCSAIVFISVVFFCFMHMSFFFFLLFFLFCDDSQNTKSSAAEQENIYMPTRNRGQPHFSFPSFCSVGKFPVKCPKSNSRYKLDRQIEDFILPQGEIGVLQQQLTTNT